MAGEAAELLPPKPSLKSLREAAADCKACPLWELGTQTVFGEGERTARLVLIGEQPGDAEDVAGKPFVGPAGRLLDEALERAGLDRHFAYVTNVVKHFKWEPRGKRRIHKKPNEREITACRPWLAAELSVLEPEVIVCLGATASQALLGRDFRVSLQRGIVMPSDLARHIMATVHPSSILRADDREHEMQAFVADLEKVSPLLAAYQ
ncbi:MAG TPA: UdgX family uracil-DNA binding protein [Dehalococcoidia bacterium]|nr:UdgX family uracil-DNA binding protein [Dehalococcoidia bacterium]